MVFPLPFAKRLSSSGIGASGYKDLPWDVLNCADVWPTYSCIIVIVGYSRIGPHAALVHEA